MNKRISHPGLLVQKMAVLLLPVFPLILLLAFVMHMHTPSDMLEFRFRQPEYSATLLFESLHNNGAAAFVHAHAGAYLSVPFMMITLLVLVRRLFNKQPLWSTSVAVLGMIGVLALSGFFAVWLSFSALARVPTQYADGVRVSLAELTRMTGVLAFITRLSYLYFVALVLLAAALAKNKVMPVWASFFVTLGCILIPVFAGLVNWMLLGSLFIFIGLCGYSSILYQSIKRNQI